jgi:hypothetical protein
VHDARPALAADAADLGRVVQQRVHERAALHAGTRVHDQARGLLEHEQRVILVHHRERLRLGCDARAAARRHRHHELVSRLQLQRRLRGAAIHQYAALRDQLLEAITG